MTEILTHEHEDGQPLLTDDPAVAAARVIRRLRQEVADLNTSLRDFGKTRGRLWRLYNEVDRIAKMAAADGQAITARELRAALSALAQPPGEAQCIEVAIGDAVTIADHLGPHAVVRLGYDAYGHVLWVDKEPAMGG